MLAWIYLSAAIATEVVGTVFLRNTDGFTKPAPSAFVIVAYVLSLWLTALALKGLEISLAYAVWAGVGTAAIASEVVGTVFLNQTDGFTKPAPSVFVLATYAVSLWLTALAVRELEISLAYAVWAGVGTAAVAVIGMATLGESVNALKLASIALVIGGVVGLNLSGAN